MKIYNKGDGKNIRRAFRKFMPKAERLLWNALKNKQVNGLRFLRQYGVEKYTLDFYCPVLRLAIEVDGDSHYITDKNQQSDKIRQNVIESHGIKVLRVTNTDVYKNLNGVIEMIYRLSEDLQNK